MITNIFVFILSYIAGAIGITNLIGTGFVFQAINIVFKLINGPDILWRIHLGNFLISCLFLVFNFKYIFHRILYLFISLLVLLPTWLVGKFISSQYEFSNYKYVVILALIIITIFNLINVFSIKINPNGTVDETENIKLNNDDLIFVGFSSLISSCFEINFGVILTSLFLILKSNLKIRSIANLVFFNMFLYSLLNLIWYFFKKEIVIFQNNEFYVFIGIILGSITSLVFYRNLNDKFLNKFSTSCILIYLITLFVSKQF